ncbi:MAG: hypothetical protein IKQ20_05835 [Bacteroidales bacterium]|nr:hypothetical protein [Bacteroidales bacterium]
MTPYIIKALQKGESICVNDLGTFSLHYVPANISGKVISAPHNIVTFDAHTGSADYAFTDLVCFEKKCLITQASNDITQWVEELKQALNHNKSVTFEGFGTFSLNDKGKISFSCDHIPELNLEFEGLEDLRTDQLWSEGVETEDVRPGTEELRPETEELRPETEELRPETEELRPETEDGRLETEELRPETEELRPKTEELRPETEELRPETEELRPETEELRPETEDGRLETDDVRTETEDEEPVIYRSSLADDEKSQNEVVENEERRTENEEPRTETEEAQIEDLETEDERPETEDEESQVANRKSHTARRKWLWWLLVLLLLAALGAAGYLFRDKLTPVYENVKEKFSKKEKVETPAETETIEVVPPVEEAEEMEPEEEPVEEVAEETPAYTPEVVKRTADDKYPYIRYEAGHYYAIVGSLPSEGDAVRHIRNRGLDQYEPKLVMQNGVGNIRVCIGIFDSEEEAEAFAKGTGLKYWILK